MDVEVQRERIFPSKTVQCMNNVTPDAHILSPREKGATCVSQPLHADHPEKNLDSGNNTNALSHVLLPQSTLSFAVQKQRVKSRRTSFDV